MFEEIVIGTLNAVQFVTSEPVKAQYGEADCHPLVLCRSYMYCISY
ncbi:MAG TPA: hypothetical protein VGN23_07330 [Verrucomicrobiae bacterium]